MWTIFKVFIEFVTVLLLFFPLDFWPRGIWGPSSPTRDQTHTPRIGRRSLNHWAAREVPNMSFSILQTTLKFYGIFPGKDLLLFMTLIVPEA